MKRFVYFALVGIGLSVGDASACDVCATHLALAAREEAGRTTVSVFEQYSDYDAPPGGGHTFTGYATQVSASHWVNGRWAVQAGLPILDKNLDNGEAHESGIGDATLLAVFRAVKHEDAAGYATVDAFAGIEAPTGDSDPLREERDAALEAMHAEEHEHEGGEEDHHAPHPHGHHVALGSGSWDGIFGVSGLWKRGRVMGMGEAQYVLRTEGDFDFEYGDEVIGRAGLFWFALLEDAGSIAAGAEVTADRKAEDRVMGVKQDGSDGDAVYAGPSLRATWNDRLAASFAWDIAVSGEDEGLEGAASTRVRGALAMTL